MRSQEVSDSALKVAKREGADKAEVFLVQSRTISAYADDSKLKSIEEKADLGIAVRVIKDGRVGQSSSTIATIKQAEACAKNAVRVSHLLPRDTVFKDFPAPAKSSISVQAMDPEVASLSVESIADLAKEIISTAKVQGKVKVPNGVLRAAAIESRVSNSNGTDVLREATMIYLHFTAMTEGKKPGEGDVSFYSSYLKHLDPTSLGNSLNQRAISSSRASSFEGTAKLDVLIPPHELSELFRDSVSFALSAENVNRRRSPWATKKGKAVGSKLLNLVDDPGDPRGTLSSPYDDEGSPTRRKDLIKEGKLTSFLYDTYNASMSGVPPTGNGVRRSSIESIGTYQIPVSIGPICMVMKPGPRSVEQVIASIDEGIFIEKFASPEVHPITGAFGLEVRCGHLIKKGEVVGTVKHCLLMGNLFESLGKIIEVANDATVSMSYIMPSVCFEGLELVGSEHSS